jgi:hypothetical protein
MKTSNWLMGLGSLILITVYFVPIWFISLDAPQFPEGLGLYIYVNDIKGCTPTDLESLNILNHYIGMKKIVPKEIPEFKIIPIALGGLIALGFIFSFLKNNWLKLLWLGLVFLGAIIGIYDYYLWGYDYGHNLDPNAILKVPGMAYQPPLIGGKQLLNIYAFSFPYWGAGIILLSLILVILSYYLGKKEKRNVAV